MLLKLRLKERKLEAFYYLIINKLQIKKNMIIIIRLKFNQNLCYFNVIYVKKL